MAGVGERIEAVLYTPLLSDELQVVCNVLGDGKNIHIDDADNDRRHIHLVYNGKDHFNALVSKAAVETGGCIGHRAGSGLQEVFGSAAFIHTDGWYLAWDGLYSIFGSRSGWLSSI